MFITLDWFDYVSLVIICVALVVFIRERWVAWRKKPVMCKCKFCGCQYSKQTTLTFNCPNCYASQTRTLKHQDDYKMPDTDQDSVGQAPQKNELASAWQERQDRRNRAWLDRIGRCTKSPRKPGLT